MLGGFPAPFGAKNANIKRSFMAIIPCLAAKEHHSCKGAGFDHITKVV